MTTTKIKFLTTLTACLCGLATFTNAQADTVYYPTTTTTTTVAPAYQAGPNYYQLGNLYYHLGGQLGLGYNNKFGAELLAGLRASAHIFDSNDHTGHINFINYVNLHQSTKYTKLGLGLGVGASYDIPNNNVTILGDLRIGLGASIPYTSAKAGEKSYSGLSFDTSTYFGVRFLGVYELGVQYSNFAFTKFYASTDLVFSYYF